mmetsp:Transcript_1569/g.3530  ORF Transcript_1569/g.3530 Transcript_1569/m.3530 type:complete len:104 (-) Transcript_1569:1249-1560(-)
MPPKGADELDALVLAAGASSVTRGQLTGEANIVRAEVEAAVLGQEATPKDGREAWPEDDDRTSLTVASLGMLRHPVHESHAPNSSPSLDIAKHRVHELRLADS